MRVLYFLIAAGALFGQPAGLRVDGVTSTQAIVSYIPPSGAACTIEVSESPSYSPVVNDVNTSLFASSNSDAARSIVTDSGTGRRSFIVGTNTSALDANSKMDSRALRADTLHFARVTCGSTAVTTFTTAQIHGLVPEDPPFSTDGHGNYAFPDRNYTSAGRNLPVIDPQTGAATYLITNPKDASAVWSRNFNSGIYLQGGSWTNPGNITAANSGTTASTGTANAPIVVLINGVNAGLAPNWNFLASSHPEMTGVLVDLGLHLFGNGTDATAGNRQLKVEVSLDSGQTAYGSPIFVTMPTSAGDVGIVPTTFPTAGVANSTWEPFIGWGKIIPRGYLNRPDSMDCVAGACSVSAAQNTFGADRFFNPDWAAGSKYYIPGSSGTCNSPANFCTIASITDDQHMVLVEALTISGAVDSYFAGLSFRITKTTGTGTVNVSASYNVAKSYALNVGQQNGCDLNTVTANVDRDGTPISPGVVGRLCIFEMEYTGPSALYFVGRDVPDFRLLSLFRLPDTPPMGYEATLDWPSSAGSPPDTSRLLGPLNDSQFDTTDPNTIYLGASPSGNIALFKATYTGDYRETAGLFFAMAPDGFQLPTYVNDSVTWTNLTRKSLSHDIRAQVLGAAIGYSESLLGTINPSLVGIAKGTAFFYQPTQGGSQNNPCSVFQINATNGNFVSYFNTAQGTGAAGMHWAGCHAIRSFAERIEIEDDLLSAANSSIAYGGPFEAVPTAVWKSGAPNANTSLPGTYNGSYDGACPGGLAQQWIDLGATGNHCVKIRIPTQLCSATPTTNEKAATPCPGDASKSYIGSEIAPGDELFDNDPTMLGDSEHLLVVKVTVVSGNVRDVDVLRDAGRGYCCFASTRPGPECVGSSTQAVHSNGWTVRGASLGSCSTNNHFISTTDPTDVLHEHQMFTRGHFGYVVPSTGAINNIGISAFAGAFRARFGVATSTIGSYSGFPLVYSPTFGGVALNTGYTQSYIGASIGGIATDWKHTNPGNGAIPEAGQQTIGPVLTIALVGGQTNTYKITGFTAPNLKVQPMGFWYGLFNSLDISSGTTGNVISDASGVGRKCYAYRVNQCRTGSSIGDLYVVAPNLNTAITTCNTSQTGQRIACAMALGAGMSQILQYQGGASDVSGLEIRKIGYSNTRPTSMETYARTRPFDSTVPTKFFSSQYHTQGLVTGAILVDPGGWTRTSQTGSDYAYLPVSVPTLGGSDGARVRFGVVGRGTLGTNFYGGFSAEDTVTDSVLTPFAFVGDSLTPTPCSSGCTIKVPLTPNRITVYQLEQLNGGSVVQTWPIQLVAR